jgi:type II secretory pathway component PulC
MPYFKDTQNKLYFVPNGCMAVSDQDARALMISERSRNAQAQAQAQALKVEEKTEDEIERERILFQMSEIERQITARRLREAILTDEGRAWLMNWEMELQELRSELKELKS